jgi:formylglycine-generating enzyme required for sulfatase activity
MKYTAYLVLAAVSLLLAMPLTAQTRLPDTGQTGDFTSTFGEDADYTINPPRFTDNGDGTVTDAVTGLIWQRTDGGEMTFAQAEKYADTLTLAGHGDWRLPVGHELFAILNHGASKPAMDVIYFPVTTAEYWWTSDKRADDPTRIWVTNSGGGIGAHLMSETISAGGAKRFHVRCVRGQTAPPASGSYTDHGDGTVTDNNTGLMWRTALTPDSLTWEAALQYCESLTYGVYSDWRLPNVKELQSLTTTAYVNPCFAPGTIAAPKTLRIWSSTTLVNQTQRAWDLQTDFGIVSYSDKTARRYALCVRGGTASAVSKPEMATIPAGVFEMGDHFGFVDPAHPSDEVPIHSVHVDSFYLAKTLSTNGQYFAFLNAALLAGSIEVRNNMVYRKGDTNAYCFTNQSAAYYSISYDGKAFAMADFRANHPMVGVLWCGAAAYCNWLSAQDGLAECYNLGTWECDFLMNGYRLPTEAEWEWAGRGGHINPYFNYPFGNTIEVTKANLPGSGDPYETGSLPNTTPVGFYDGTLKQKSDYNWPGAVATYQTSDGANGFGLYDMQGNVWEFLNDWYGQDYYSVSPYDNPKGPASGFIMPDGKPYRGVRGGNWYNGLVVNGVNDGHSRVSNRNPSYYRGPGDANAPWHHTGFRIARKFEAGATGVAPLQDGAPDGFRLYQNYPNPFNPSTTIRFSIARRMDVTLYVYDALGREVKTLVDQSCESGIYQVQFNAASLQSGLYFCRLQAGSFASVVSMHLIK